MLCQVFISDSIVIGVGFFVFSSSHSFFWLDANLSQNTLASRTTIIITRTLLPENVPLNLAVVAGVIQRLAGLIGKWFSFESLDPLLAFRAVVKQSP